MLPLDYLVLLSNSDRSGSATHLIEASVVGALLATCTGVLVYLRMVKKA